MTTSALPTQFVIDAEVFAKVHSILAWYESMPQALKGDEFSVGDRFHENIRDILDVVIPGVEGDDFFIECHNFTADNKWTVTFREVGNEENSIDVEVVPAQ